MRRPSSGKTFEEALEHWSASDAYSAWKELEQDPFKLDGRFKPGDFTRQFHAVRDAREELEDDLFERLSRGELLSSAMTISDDHSAPRLLIRPETYGADLVRYIRESDCIDAGGVQLFHIEIFVPTRVPKNIVELPEWLSDIDAHLRRSATAPSARPEFRHDRSYRHVRLGDREFHLTGTQAAVVRALHEAAIAESEWMEFEELREAVGFDTAKLSQLFRRMPNWRDLIESDRRGSYRLNT